MSSIAHHFLDVDTKPYKIQPGGPGYELLYGSTGIVPYLLSLTPENSLQASFNAIALYEQELLKILLGYLTHPEQKARGVRIVGDENVNLTRVPTISFVVIGERPIKSKDVVAIFDRKGGVRLSKAIFAIVCALILVYRSVYVMATSTHIHLSPRYLRTMIQRMASSGYLWFTITRLKKLIRLSKYLKRFWLDIAILIASVDRAVVLMLWSCQLNILLPELHGSLLRWCWRAG